MSALAQSNTPTTAAAINGRAFTGILSLILGAGLAIGLYYANKYRPDFPEFWGGSTMVYTGINAKLVPAPGGIFWLAMSLLLLSALGLLIGGGGVLARMVPAAWILVASGLLLMLAFAGITLANMLILVTNVRDLQMSLAFISAGTAILASLGYIIAGNGWALRKMG